jgi:hypothetical protein
MSRRRRQPVAAEEEPRRVNVVEAGRLEDLRCVKHACPVCLAARKQESMALGHCGCFIWWILIVSMGLAYRAGCGLFFLTNGRIYLSVGVLAAVLSIFVGTVDLCLAYKAR